MTSFSASIIALPGKLAVTALLSILLISSCSDPASVGLELAPGNNQIGVFYHEFNLDAQVVLLDSFNTVNSGVLVVGNENDEFFGKTEGTGYSRMYFDSNAKRPVATAVLDSMFFQLDVVSVNGSNLDQPKTYSVHKLTEPILDTLYYNFNALSFEETPFSSIDFTFDEVKDTLIKMPVTEDFQNEFFGALQEGRDNEFDNLFTFREYFPGIAVKAKEGDNATIGVALGGNTGIQVYYHDLGDTIAKRFDIVTFPSRSFNGIKSDRSGTPTEVITESGKSYDVGQVVGMKSTLALAMRIDTSPIDEFLDTLSGVTFNQVLFTMGEIENQDEDNNPISTMVLKFIDSENRTIQSSLSPFNDLHVITDGQAQVILDQNGDTVPNNFFAAVSLLQYNSETKSYSARITSHTNAIFRGQLQRRNWLLFPDSPNSFSNGGLSNNLSDFARSLRQFKVNKDKIKIQVIYSKTR